MAKASHFQNFGSIRIRVSIYTLIISDSKPSKKTKSVHERLGIVKGKKTSSRLPEDSDDPVVKRSRDVSVPSGGKRIKLNNSGKYHTEDKSKKSRSENIGKVTFYRLFIKFNKITDNTTSRRNIFLIFLHFSNDLKVLIYNYIQGQVSHVV